MSAMVNSLPAAYLRWARRSSQTLRYRFHRSLNQPTVGAWASFTFEELKIAPSVGVMSVDARISASRKAGRSAGFFGRCLPDFSAQYIRIALDWERVAGLPPGPSWSTITGICPIGFMARNFGVWFSPFSRLIGWKL